MFGGYDIAQICKNGHVTNSATKSRPENNQKSCMKCGEATITTCPECSTPIRGIENAPGWQIYTTPAFCINCGNPFPWTQAKVQAARDLAQELDDLNEQDRIILQKSIDELVKDSPSTTVAATRFKKIMLKAGQGAASMFQEILVDVVSETAKKMLWP